MAHDADPARSAGYYQHLHDDWDIDHPFKRLLVDTAVAPDAVAWINPRLQPGEERPDLTRPPRQPVARLTRGKVPSPTRPSTPTAIQSP